MSESAKVRAQAAKILQSICEEGQTLTHALSENKSPLLQEICYGTLRYYPRLIKLSEHLLSKPLKTKDHEILYLLLSGFYQLLYMHKPEHAVVAETVAATKYLKKNWAKGLVNAVLRNLIRGKQELLAELDQKLDSKYAHPDWFIQIIRTAWPEDWQEILNNNNQYPPMTLRVNLAKISREEYLQALQQAGIVSKPHEQIASAIVLDKPVNVTDLPGFYQGQVSVQDAASQLIPSFLDLKPGLKVLDACAAPGGKTAHIYETENNLAKIIALDVEANRLQQCYENQQRLGFACEFIQADANDLDAWWDGGLFDRVLLDAPCTALGVIRRHPDLKILRTEEDLDYITHVQEELLYNLWQVVAPGGKLVYSTCSILPAENQQQIANFLEENSDAKLMDLPDPWQVPGNIGRQILPGQYQMDGFYYAVVYKE